MLRWRILLGVVFSATLAGICWLDAQSTVAGAWLFPVVVLITVLATDELVRMIAGHGTPPMGWVAQSGNLLIVAANWLPQFRGTHDPWEWLVLALAIALGLAILREIATYPGTGRQTERLAATAFAFLYVGLLLSFMVQLRFVGPRGAWGLTALVTLLLTVKFADIGAYTVGRLIGRHKLAPRLSPGKTIEGGIGGLLFATFGTWLGLKVIGPAISTAPLPEIGIAALLGFGITVGTAGIVGDLAESLLKRDLGRKDSSNWMPGFGGVLDIVDSLLVGAPVAYVWWSYCW